MAKVLVVGGAGYIGSQTAKHLQQHQHEIFVFDNFSTGFRDLVKFGELIEGDICEPDSINSAVAKVQPDVVMHFAANALVGESVANPAKYYRNNVVGTLNLLNAICEHRSRAAIIFSSTCAVYGEPQGPLHEEHPLAPVNPYGESKRVMEEAFRYYGEAYGMRTICLRYFNAAGADREGQIGELHDPETHLIPRLLLKLAGKLPSKDQLMIWGDDYDTPDGTCIRDYVHVEDIAKAHRLAMEKLLNGGSSAIYNLGTGRGYSVREIIAEVEKITGGSLDLPIGPRRPGDPAKLVASYERAKSDLGWEPEIDLKTIVETAWAWTQSQGESS